MRPRSVRRSRSTSAMFAALTAGLLLCCLRATAAGTQLPAPQNVSMVALNTNYTLTWDWDWSQDVTFTTEYVAKFKLKYRRSVDWVVMCKNESHRSCSLTNDQLYHLGIWLLRVQASRNGLHSDWVQVEFDPDKDADIGPPSGVVLSRAGSVLDVVISDPLTSSNGSMREIVPELYFRVVYWEDSGDSQRHEDKQLTSKTRLVTLPDLKAWTQYCVTVQSRADFFNKSSSFTSPLCMQTEGATAWWVIFLWFLGSLLICFLVALIVIFGFYRTYRIIKDTFSPSSQLPAQFKAYLCDSPGSDIPHLLAPDSESELLFDKLIICSKPVLEIHSPPPEAPPAPPSGLEPDSSGRHSRQGSSGSRDSGVYSTGGSSGSQQSSSSGSDQTCAGSDASWPGPCDPGQVKMQDMGPALSSVIADEGIVDVCV